MAKQQVTTYTDDVTGKPMDQRDARTVYVRVGRETWELDISPGTFVKMIEPLINAGRKTRPELPGNVVQLRESTTPTRPDKAQNQAMRAWWYKNQKREGLPPANPKGRIPNEIITAYHQHGGREIVEDVPPAQEPRKAGAVGREMKFAEPQARKRAPAKAATRARRTSKAS